GVGRRTGLGARAGGIAVGVAVAGGIVKIHGKARLILGLIIGVAQPVSHGPSVDVQILLIGISTLTGRHAAKLVLELVGRIPVALPHFRPVSDRMAKLVVGFGDPIADICASGNRLVVDVEDIVGF